MRVLVVGSGGREHALAWKLSQEAEVICAPGNPGIAEDCECVEVKQTDFDGLTALCKSRAIDLVVVGPEDPLVDGLADVLRDAGFAVFGPGKLGAKLEASKAFSKEWMTRAGIRTAASGTFTDSAEADAFAESLDRQGYKVVVKASGNALGKGVVVCDDLSEAYSAIKAMLVDRIYGEAGATIVVEQRLIGREFSLLTISSENGFHSLPIAQDHKRALDNDGGANTGGMGTYSPVPWVSDAMVRHAEERIVKPMLSGLAAAGILYRGVLFSGVMVEGNQSYCLEFNVRFGDPEIQTLVLRMGKGFLAALHAAALGFAVPPIEIKPVSAITVVVASGGYPGSYTKGKPVTIGNLPDGVKLFHAATAMRDGELVTTGGRVFGVSAVADTLDEAKKLAYQAAEMVKFDGAYYRKDIGAKST